MVNKKVVIICSIIAIIVVSLIVVLKIREFNNKDYGIQEEETIKINQNIEIPQNIVKEENITEENKVEEPTITTKEEDKIQKNNTSNNDVKGEEEISSEKENNNENSKEKALKLVKEEWGEDSTVYYTVDNQSSNIYNVSVRSKETTATLVEYIVDINEGTVTIN